ncbi:hypothetical protein [Microbacterium sp. JZ101]
MSTPTTPPAFDASAYDPAAVPPRPAPPTPPASGGKVVALVVAVIGGVALLGTAIGSGVAAARGAFSVDETLTAAAAGVTSLDIDASGASFAIAYGDVDEAVLEVTNADDGWRVSRDGGELSVDRRDGFFRGWWFGGDWFGGDWFDDEQTVVLTLPERLKGAGLDVDLSLSGGSLTAEGDFGEVDAEVGAGYLSLDGSVASLEVDLSAGQADLALADVAEAGFTVAAGRLDAELTGDAPAEVTVDVSAGSLDLVLPDETYAVRSDVSAGDFDNRLDVESSSPREISVQVAAGDATLRPGGASAR